MALSPIKNCNAHYICYGKFIVGNSVLNNYRDTLTAEELTCSRGLLGVEKLYEDERTQLLSSKNHTTSLFKPLCIHSMKEGEKAVFLIDSTYFFGDNKVPLNEKTSIPPHSSFVYYFEMKQFEEYRTPDPTHYKEGIDFALIEKEVINQLFRKTLFKKALTGYRRWLHYFNNIKSQVEEVEYKNKLVEVYTKFRLHSCRCLLKRKDYTKLATEVDLALHDSLVTPSSHHILYFLRAKGNLLCQSTKEVIQKDIDTAIQYCTTTTDSIPPEYLNLKHQVETTTHGTSHLKTFAQNMFKTSGIYQDKENQEEEEEEVFLHFPQANKK